MPMVADYFKQTPEIVKRMEDIFTGIQYQLDKDFVKLMDKVFGKDGWEVRRHETEDTDREQTYFYKLKFRWWGKWYLRDEEFKDITRIRKLVEKDFILD